MSWKIKAVTVQKLYRQVLHNTTAYPRIGSMLLVSCSVGEHSCIGTLYHCEGLIISTSRHFPTSSGCVRCDTVAGVNCGYSD